MPSIGAGVPLPRSPRRLARRSAVTLACLLVALVVALGAFPFAPFKNLIARRLSASLGREVTIASVGRASVFSFVPTLRIEGLRIAQPAWAGPGTMAAIGRATVRFPILPALFGRIEIRTLAIEGLSLDLRRNAAGRANWEGRKGGGGGGSPPIDTLVIRDGALRLVDLRRHMSLAATITADPAVGLTIAGCGTQRGQPMTLAFQGARIDAASAGKSYPFSLRLRSPLLVIDGRGQMRRALDTGHFTARLKTSGHDLADLDDAIQAGLPGTQTFAFTADIAHDAPDWSVRRLDGTIGRSTLAGDATIRKRDGRTIIDAAIASSRFDFDDLSSDAGLARAAAERARTGKRLIPDTQIHLDHLAHTDGTIRFSTKSLLSKGRTAFRSLAATLNLDHRVLTVSAIRAALAHGAVTGSARVDDSSGSPHLTLDLTLSGARITDLFTRQTNLDGPLLGRVRLAGVGRSVRDALAASSGSVGLVSRGGTMDRKLAVLASGDVLGSVGAVIGGGDTRVPLRCMIARFAGSNGRLAADPLVLDTSLARADGGGRIDLDGERLELAIDGRAKEKALLSVKPAVQITGTISDPDLTIATTAGHHGLLAKAGEILGHLHIGKGAAPKAAEPVDCAALSARALG